MVCVSSLPASHLCWLHSRLPDGVDAHDSDPVARDNAVCEVAVTVELHVTGKLSLRHCVWALLQLQDLPCAMESSINSSACCTRGQGSRFFSAERTAEGSRAQSVGSPYTNSVVIRLRLCMYWTTLPSHDRHNTWKSTHLHLSGTIKNGSMGHFGRPACSLHVQDKPQMLSTYLPTRTCPHGQDLTQRGR